MPAQHRASKKNYIGILKHRVDQDALMQSDRPVKHYLLGWMATVLNRNIAAREPLSRPAVAPRPDPHPVD